jgi:hypothetical protein
VHILLLSLYLPPQAKLWCTLHLRGQIHSISPLILYVLCVNTHRGRSGVRWDASLDPSADSNRRFTKKSRDFKGYLAPDKKKVPVFDPCCFYQVIPSQCIRCSQSLSCIAAAYPKVSIYGLPDLTFAGILICSGPPLLPFAATL